MAKLFRSSGPHKGKDLVGLKFGRWRVVDFAGWFIFKRGHACLAWDCVCRCGTEAVLNGGQLRSGRSKSCGCWMPQLVSEGRRTHWEATAWRRSPLYRRWTDMWSRCTNEKTKRWEYYGGRGIKVCRRWKSFEAFKADMGSIFDPKLWLERVNNNKGYSKDNCRWATQREQSWNKSNNRMIRIGKVSKPLGQWCYETGVNYFKAWKRLRRGWLPRDAIRP